MVWNRYFSSNLGFPGSLQLDYKQADWPFARNRAICCCQPTYVSILRLIMALEKIGQRDKK